MWANIVRNWPDVQAMFLEEKRISRNTSLEVRINRLPSEIIGYIYEYDPTYRDIFDKSIKYINDMVNNKSFVLLTYKSRFSSINNHSFFIRNIMNLDTGGGKIENIVCLLDQKHNDNIYMKPYMCLLSMKLIDISELNLRDVYGMDIDMEQLEQIQWWYSSYGVFMKPLGQGQLK